jgi:L-alanine-DL-glutamate epimerase-like enolase superfamily enzyme
LRQQTRVPIAGGEALTGAAEFGPWLDAGAFDYVQPDATHVGGIGQCLRVAQLAAESHAGLIVHTGAAIGPGLMANLHVAFASPNARFVEYAVAPDNVRRDLLAESDLLADGFFRLPTAPGLGAVLPASISSTYPYRPGHSEFS